MIKQPKEVQKQSKLGGRHLNTKCKPDQQKQKREIATCENIWLKLPSSKGRYINLVELPSVRLRTSCLFTCSLRHWITKHPSSTHCSSGVGFNMKKKHFILQLISLHNNLLKLVRHSCPRSWITSFRTF